MKIYELNIDFANPSQKAVQTIDDMPIGFKVTATVKGVPFDGLVWIDFAGYSSSEKISIANGGTFEIEFPRNGVFKIANQENVDANYMAVKVSTSIVKSDFYFESKGGFDPAVLSDYVTTDDLDATLSDYAKTDDLSAYAKNDDLSAYATNEYVDGKISETNAKIDEAKKIAKNAGGSSSSMLIADSLSGLICSKINDYGDITPSDDFVLATASAPNGPAWQLPSIEHKLIKIDFQNVSTTTWSTLTTAEAEAGVKTIRSVPKRLYLDVDTGFNFNDNFKLWDIADSTTLPKLFDPSIVEKRAFPAIHDGVQVGDGKAYVFDGYLAQLPYKPAENTANVSCSYIKISDVKGFFSTAFKFWSANIEGLDYMLVSELELENVDTICFDNYVQPGTLTVKGDFSAIDVSNFRGVDSIKIEGRSLLTAVVAKDNNGYKSKFTTFEMLDVASTEFLDWLMDAYAQIAPEEPLEKNSESYVYAFNVLFNWDTSVEYTEIKLKDVTLHGNPTTTGFWNQQWPTVTFEDVDGNKKSFHVSAATSWQTINNDPFIPTAVKATFRQNLDSTAAIPFSLNALNKTTALKTVVMDFKLAGRMLPPTLSFLGVAGTNNIVDIELGENASVTVTGNISQGQVIGGTKVLDRLAMANLSQATKMIWTYTETNHEYCHKLEIGNSVDANGKQTTIADIKNAFMVSDVAMDAGAALYPRIGWQPAEIGDCEVWFNGLHIFTFGDGYSETVDGVTTFKWVCKWEKFPVA